jgi:hypothetical protein
MSRYTPPDCDLQLDLFLDVGRDGDVQGCVDVELDPFDCDVEGRAEVVTSKIADIVLAPHWQTRRALIAQIGPLVLSELSQLVEEIRANLRE